MYMYVHSHIYTRDVCTYIHITCAHTYACTHRHMRVYTYTYMVHTRIHIPIHIHASGQVSQISRSVVSEEFTQTHVHWVGDAIQPLILCCPLLLPPSIFPSIRVFSREWVLWIRWPKDWSFSFSISSSNEYSGLILFRMDWLDLLAVQVALKSLLKHHSSKALILQRSAFLIVQLSHPYMTTGKTVALTKRTFLVR